MSADERSRQVRVSRGWRGFAAVATLAALALLAPSGASEHRATTTAGDVNWSSFGNTVDENRYQALTQIDASNGKPLGRAFTVDLNKFVPGIKKGQQTSPIVVNGQMYITSGDDQVFDVNATTGALVWHYTPSNVATFKNF